VKKCLLNDKTANGVGNEDEGPIESLTVFSDFSNGFGKHISVMCQCVNGGRVKSMNDVSFVAEGEDA
jgi:hypothetical protein